MPIKPENKDRYPSNWKQIRAQILERASNTCEQCGLKNYEVILRKVDGTWRSFGVGEDHADAKQLAADTHWSLHGDENWPKLTIVVLTIAHLDHVPENCAPENLKALCQKCHLTYDAKHHAESAQATRRAKSPTGQLFA